jgi:hypothetical protein
LFLTAIICWASVAAAQTELDSPSSPAFIPVGMTSLSQPETVATDLGDLVSRPASCAVGSWSFISETMFLQRSSGDHIPVATGTPQQGHHFLLDPPISPLDVGPPYTMGSEDLDFKTATGWRLSATRHGEQFDTEVAYFQVDDFAAHLAPPGSVSIPFRFPDGWLWGADLVGSRFDYHSQLSSLECNVRRPCSPRLALLAGLRYARLDELYGVSGRLEDDWLQPPTEMNLRAQNNLWGFQIGADATIWRHDRLTIGSSIKGGIYYDRVRRDDLDPLPIMVNLCQDQASFLGELNLTAAYQLTAHVSLCAGYQLMWLDGVGMASDPITLRPYWADGELPGMGVLDGKNTVFYHGALAGVELAW